VLACGLRRDTLRVQPLLGIAHDRRWPKPVRLAACKALGMIGDPAASDGLRTLVVRETDADVKNAAVLAQKRLHVSTEARSA
jgi:HEAT repeat protein